ncbi:MAG: sensor histidine kinase [Chloroflexota bacterium]
MEHVRMLVDCSPLPMLATRGRAHIICYANPAFRSLVGQTTAVVVGDPLGALLRTDPRLENDHTLELLDRVYATGTAEMRVDLVQSLGDLEGARFQCAVWPILGANDRPDGLLIQVTAPTGEATRHTERVRAEELRDANERLLLAGLKAQEQADVEITLRGEAEAALAMRDEFILIAAHELRTPVTAIKTGAQLLLHTLDDASQDAERTIRYLRGIVGGADRLELLINDLTDVSRMQTGQLLLRLVPVDLVGLVRAVTLRHADRPGGRHRVTTDVPTAPVVVAGDAARLEQVLDNLLSNGVKYSPDGGEINVGVRRAADGVVLTVRDNGIGLPPGTQERIFEPFGRASNATRQGLPGMGLGLHICRQIAAAHGGRMWAESEGEGRGLTMTVWLPVLPSVTR